MKIFSDILEDIKAQAIATQAQDLEVMRFSGETNQEYAKSCNELFSHFSKLEFEILVDEFIDSLPRFK